MSASISTQAIDIDFASGADHMPWEQKGRGVAVFRYTDTQRPAIASQPDTTVLAPADNMSLQGTERRVVLHGFSIHDFLDPDCINTFTNRVVLPAYRRYLPLYLFSSCAPDDLKAGRLSIEHTAHLHKAFGRLGCEQLRILVAFMCVVMPSLDARLSDPPLTPIERFLAAGLEAAGIRYTLHAPIGPHTVDFLLTTSTGRRVAVETDGRAHLDPNRASRDDALMAAYGITDVIRFSGCQILYNRRKCVEHIQSVLSSSPHISNGFTPEPLPALSDEQARCLRPPDGAVLTLAPAGSGKTRVLTRRVVEAVRQGIPAERVLCVVFNKDASEVMRDRIHHGAGLHGVRICTLHSLGYEICRTAPDSRYAHFNVVTNQSLPGGLRRLFRRMLKEDFIQAGRLPKIIPEHLVAAYEESLAQHKKTLTPIGVMPGDFDIEHFDRRQALRVSRKVEEALFQRRLLTFDDQIYRAVETLLERPRARRRYQVMYDTLLVDEVQDLTPVQFLLARLLSFPLHNLFAVGDDDQMINSFAGADPANIRDFQHYFPGAVIHTLGENHRCAPELVRRSAHVITYNRHRFSKPIRPAGNGAPPGTIRLFHGGSMEAEAHTAVDTIKAWKDAGVAYSDMAVLVRVKSVASLVQLALSRHDIPFHPMEQAQFFQSPAGRALGAFLSICRNPETAAPAAYSRAVGVTTRYLSNNHLRRIAVDGWRLIRRPTIFPPYIRNSIEEFCHTVRQVHHNSRKKKATAQKFLGEILDRFAIETHFMQKEKVRRRTTVLSASDIIESIRSLAVEYPDIETFVDAYHKKMLEERTVSKSEPDGGDKIRITTMHSSKGGEYRAVIIFHAAEYTIPHRRMIETGDPADIEEERRVFYVALTRAIEHLLITTDTSRPSRFLKELDRPYQERAWYNWKKPWYRNIFRVRRKG